MLAAFSVLIPAVAFADEPLHVTAAEVLFIEGRGYSPPPYSIDDRTLQGEWRPVALPHAVLPERVEAAVRDDRKMPLTVVEWYRLRVPEMGPATGPRYLYIPRWKTDGQLAVYGNGRLLYQSHADKGWNGWNIPLHIALDETADAEPPRTILFRIERPRYSGGGISSVWIDDASHPAWRYRVRDLLQIQLPRMSGAAFLAVGVFSLFVWFYRRDKPLYLLFFLVSLASYLRSMHFYVGTERLPIPEEWFSWMTVNSLFWMVAVVHFFLNYLHGHPSRRLNRIVAGTTVALTLATLPPLAALPDVYVLSSITYVALIAMGTAVATVGMRKSRKAKSRDGMLLAGWGIVGMGFGVHDWLLQNNFIGIEAIYLGPYANILAFLIFVHIMFRRYVGAIREVELTNATLEDRLRAREAELNKTHRDLRDIERRQVLAQERQRLMQDMHDGVGSSLVSALRVVEHGQIGEAEIAGLLRSCIEDLKLIIDSLEPEEADLLLLLATLRFRLGPRLEASGIALHWDVRDVPPLEWLTPQHSLHILRILQEVFSNIIKHAKATRIRVATATEDDGHVAVTIADNGCGFDVDQALAKGGRGLANQKRRADAIDAQVRWASDATGTRFILRLPRSRASGIAPIPLPASPLKGEEKCIKDDQ